MKVALQQSQIDAAGRLHARLEQWQMSDSALERLKATMSGFDESSCVLKVVAVNSLYSTHVFAEIRMAKHVCNMCRNFSSGYSASKLVDAIAAIPVKKGEKPRRHVSFASKFCHFFIDPERFPIYDEAARVALRHHLGRTQVKQQQSDYANFLDKVATLKGEGGFACSVRELDRYLWIVGMYVKWTSERQKVKPQMNRELSSLFESTDSSIISELGATLPARILNPGNTGC